RDLSEAAIEPGSRFGAAELVGDGDADRFCHGTLNGRAFEQGPHLAWLSAGLAPALRISRRGAPWSDRCKPQSHQALRAFGSCSECCSRPAEAHPALGRICPVLASAAPGVAPRMPARRRRKWAQVCLVR